MATPQWGRNSGLTGLIDLPNVGVSGVKFEIRVYKWSSRLQGTTRPRRGRGGGIHRTVRFLFTDGNIAFTFRVSASGWPSPDAFKGQTGTITVTIDTGKTIEYPVLINELGFSFDEAKQDVPFGAGAALVTGAPTYRGWSRTPQPTATNPTRSDQQQYDGTSFTVDANTILAGGELVIDWWDGGVADSNAGELAKLTQVVSDTAVPAPFKKRPATIKRDAPDGGTITIPLGLTDTADDWVNPKNLVKNDPKKIASGGTVAKLDSPPPVPTISGGTLVSRGTTPIKLNDGKTGYVTDVGQRSTQDDVEMEESSADIDKSGMASRAQTVKVFDVGAAVPSDAASPHASLKAVGTAIKNINLDENKKITRFEPNSEIEKWLFERTKANTDSSLLKDVAIKGQVFTTGSEPSPPGATGLVYRDKIVFTLVSPDTTNLSGVLWMYGQTTTADDEMFPRLRTETDPFGIDSVQITGAFFTTGSPPSDPSVPSGLQLTGKIDLTLTNASASNQSLRLYRYEKLTSRDKLVLPHTFTSTVAGGVKSEAESSYLDGETPPTVTADANGVALQVRETEVRQITHPDYGNRQQTIRKHGTNTPIQDIEFAETEAESDPIDKYLWRDASVVAWTDTAKALTISLDNTYRPTDQSYVKASARKITPALARQILTFTGEDKKVHSASRRSFLQDVNGLPTGGWNTPGAILRVRVPGPPLLFGSYSKVYVRPQAMERARGSFKLRRRFITANPGLYFFLAIMGRTNNIAFENFDAHEVKYVGPEVVYQRGTTGPRLVVIDYIFETDSQKWFIDRQLPLGTSFPRDPFGSTPVPSSGYYNAFWFDEGFGAGWLPEADFGGFLA